MTNTEKAAALRAMALALHARADEIDPPPEVDLRAMMRDPRYWRDRNPAMVAAVAAGMRAVTGAGIATAHTGDAP